MSPLKGDGNGVYRVLVQGNSGTGKSTLADQLGDILHLPVLHLDQYYWLPNWQERNVQDFKEVVLGKLDKCEGGWVVDGNYRSKMGNHLEDECTDIIWLDPPLLLYFPRIFFRTIGRMFGLFPQCREGCNESFMKAFFSRDSILLWCLTHHRIHRAYHSEKMKSQGPNGKTRRIGGWGGELQSWLADVKGLRKNI